MLIVTLQDYTKYTSITAMRKVNIVPACRYFSFYVKYFFIICLKRFKQKVYKVNFCSVDVPFQIRVVVNYHS